MSSHAYSEDQLVEQPAIGLFATLGWKTVSAMEETFGAGSTLGRETKGEVVLVGAGPGDAGLLTLHALQAMQAADVVLYDALVSDEILALVRKDADKISVGKRAGAHHVQQEETNRLLLHYAQQGKRVVRLKGGDPFIKTNKHGRGTDVQVPQGSSPDIKAKLAQIAAAAVAANGTDEDE